MKRVSLVPLLALLTGACVESESTAPRPLPIERIIPTVGREFTGLRDPARLVIRDARRFAEVWREAYAGYQPAPAVPEVDFTRQLIIVVAMGEQRSGGYAIDVTEVSATGGKLVVQVKSAVPGSSCATHDALTQPIDIVKVPARSGAVEFHDRTGTHDCR